MKAAKIFKIILLLIYVVFAVVQFNDPDPLYWITIYGIAAIMVILNLTGRQSRIVLGIFILVGVILSFGYIDGVIDYFTSDDLGALTDKMHYDRPFIELTREFFGMWIVIGGMTFLFFSRKK